jgi:hypothetical protein
LWPSSSSAVSAYWWARCSDGNGSIRGDSAGCTWRPSRSWSCRLESTLRRRAGQAPYEATFIQHWLQQLLYYDLPLWVFGVAYTVFGALIVGLWWRDRERLRDVMSL